MSSDILLFNNFSVKKLLEELVVKHGLNELYYYIAIVNHWNLIVGEPLAIKTEPFRLKNTILHVLVDDAAYAQHLKYFEKKILDLIASPAICDQRKVTKVNFQVGDVAAKKKNRYKPSIELLNMNAPINPLLLPPKKIIEILQMEKNKPSSLNNIGRYALNDPKDYDFLIKKFLTIDSNSSFKELNKLYDDIFLRKVNILEKAQQISEKCSSAITDINNKKAFESFMAKCLSKQVAQKKMSDKELNSFFIKDEKTFENS